MPIGFDVAAAKIRHARRNRQGFRRPPGFRAEAWDAAEDDAVLIAPMAARPTANLRTTAEKVIGRAGVEPWPRLFQHLRASCETDWVQKYPARACVKWLGHSPMIAAQHYLQVRDAHVHDAIAGGGASALFPRRAGKAAQNAAHKRRSNIPQRVAVRRNKKRKPRPSRERRGFSRELWVVTELPDGQHRIRTCDLYGVNVAL